MYNSAFQELVNIAVAESDSYFSREGWEQPNPFYIGFGNPNAPLLVIGQEKAIDKDTAYGKEAMKVESTLNPYQWQKIIEEGIDDLGYVFENPTTFKNPLLPYHDKPRRGNTWNQYQLLAKKLFPELEDYPNSFFRRAFITEINHEVSKKSQGNQSNQSRKKFMSHSFFKSFPMTIIAAGNYLSDEEIEERFGVKITDDFSEPNMKLRVFENQDEKRVVLSTRQLSNFFFNRESRDAYFGRICGSLQRYF